MAPEKTYQFRAFDEVDPEALMILFQTMQTCQLANDWSGLTTVIEQHFPRGKQLLFNALTDDVNSAVFSEPWTEPPQIDRTAIAHFPRSCLPLSRARYAVVKTIIEHMIQRKASFATFKTPSIVTAVLYVCADLGLKIPADLNRRTLWATVATLIESNRGEDLVRWQNDERWKLSPPERPSNYPPFPFQLDADDDPLCITKELYAVLYPKSRSPSSFLRPCTAMPVFDVYVAVQVGADGNGTVAAAWALLGRKMGFVIRREDASEALALLDAAVTWGHLWAGHAVRFHCSSQKFRVAVDGDAIGDRQFGEETDLLHALAYNWGFAVQTRSAEETSAGVQAAHRLLDANVVAGYENSGACIQVADALLGNAWAIKKERSKSFAFENGLAKLLQCYMTKVVQAAASLYEKDYCPGKLYRTMRREQARVRERKEADQRAERESTDMVTHKGEEDREAKKVKMKAYKETMRRDFKANREFRDSRNSTRFRAMNDESNGNALDADLYFEPAVDMKDLNEFMKQALEHESSYDDRLFEE